MEEARYYERAEDNKVRCRLCPHGCLISEGRTGICRVRKNEAGKLYSVNYGCISSIAMDPVEKKPLYHFYPGSYILSVGSLGCNFKCKFCQNYQIAQEDSMTERITPHDLVEIGCSRSDNIGIAYTYNEPSIWYEFVYDTAVLAKDKGLKNVLVTNGFINKEPLYRLLPYIDAMNIDIKSYNEQYYRDICSGMLDPVKRTVEIACNACHVEITTLIVTGLNDKPEEIDCLSKYLSSIDKNIPLHLTRYFPKYKLTNEPTPVDTLLTARDIARRHLNYVYVGNVWDADSTTYCPGCGKPLIKRQETVSMEGIQNGRCKYCGQVIPVIY